MLFNLIYSTVHTNKLQPCKVRMDSYCLNDYVLHLYWHPKITLNTINKNRKHFNYNFFILLKYESVNIFIVVHHKNKLFPWIGWILYNFLHNIIATINYGKKVNRSTKVSNKKITYRYSVACITRRDSAPQRMVFVMDTRVSDTFTRWWF